MSLIREIICKINKIDIPLITRFDLDKIISSVAIKNNDWNLFSDSEQKDFFNFCRKILSEKSKIFSHKKEIFLFSDNIQKESSFITDYSQENFVLKKSYSNYFFYKNGNCNDINRIVCYLDPWSYLSYRSAMNFWGISNSISDFVYISSIKKEKWANESNKEYEECVKNHEIMLSCSKRHFFDFDIDIFSNKFIVSRHNEVGEFIVDINGCRYSSLGQTYADMLSAPEKCGGIKSVIEYYKKIDSDKINEIIDFFDKNKNRFPRILMCRAGFIFSEIKNIEDERVESWTQFKSRGSSSKLDSKSLYKPVFSDKWDLSINVDL